MPIVPSGVASISSTVSNDVLVTSSTILIVNPFLGSSLDKIFIIQLLYLMDLVSLEPNPYLPPTIKGAFSLPANALTTSKYKGSPIDPGSLVLSNTAIFFTVSGIAANNFSIENGLYKCNL